MYFSKYHLATLLFLCGAVGIENFFAFFVNLHLYNFENNLQLWNTEAWSRVHALGSIQISLCQGRQEVETRICVCDFELSSSWTSPSVKMIPSLCLKKQTIMLVHSVLLIISIILPMSNSVELTFELPDSAKECFYEVIEKGTQATVEFQVNIQTHPWVIPRCYWRMKLTPNLSG